MITIRIDVRDGKIVCGGNGGHVRAPHQSAITWTSTGDDKKFLLEFSRLGVETSAPAADPEHWPFQETAPSEPVNTFKGTLKKLAVDGLPPVYKYNVRVGKLFLDPIVIVDR